MGRTSERVRSGQAVVERGGMLVRRCRYWVERVAREVGRLEVHVRGRRTAVRRWSERVRHRGIRVTRYGSSVRAVSQRVGRDRGHVRRRRRRVR